mmetsp:Transcript_2890/g.10522  ORF Transcript_2890/g.10522 Transcript_2890/m.10522 type:complete len:486 (+) Transcript_2890:1666-3123(+)
MEDPPISSFYGVSLCRCQFYISQGKEMVARAFSLTTVGTGVCARGHGRRRVAGAPRVTASADEASASTAGVADQDQLIAALRQKCAESRRELLAAEAALAEAERTRLGPGFDAINCNYSFIASQAGSYLQPLDGTTTPPNVLALASRNFRRELIELVKEGQATLAARAAQTENEEPCCSGDDSCAGVRAKLSELVLSNDAVWDRERERHEQGGEIVAPFAIKIPYYALCYLLDALFDGRPIQRFWFLETVARMPYLSYVSCIHLYESVGFWRSAASAKRVHFAEEWNEFHHLLIMESLGGDALWSDRFLAMHSAILYFIVLVFLWLVSPTLAYNFSELIEAHAVDTYGEFVDANEALLKELPPPLAAKVYYSGGDLWMFDEMQSTREPGSRRPSVNSLHDVFCNIRDDEGEHVRTMRSCQDEAVLVRSPNYEAAIAAGATATLAARNLLSQPEVQEAIEKAVVSDSFVDAAALIVDTLTQILPFL